MWRDILDPLTLKTMLTRLSNVLCQHLLQQGICDYDWDKIYDSPHRRKLSFVCKLHKAPTPLHVINLYRNMDNVLTDDEFIHATRHKFPDSPMMKALLSEIQFTIKQ